MNFVPPFKRWLKQQRRALGLTQAELARRTSYATVTIRKIEEGQLKPSREMALLMADALEVPAEAREDFIAFSRGMEGRRALRLLPSAGAPIISRQTELRDVAALLLREDVRLVTLVGLPGVGKTRLAIELGHALAGEFFGGVCYVPLAETRNPADVAPAIATTLGVLVPYQQSPAQALIHALQPVEMLLILDNFEHVLEAANLVSDLLVAVPDLTVLATSRAPLDLTSEHRYEVLPLAVPAQEDADAAVVANPSVQLFAQRAQSVKPSFKITPMNMRSVAEVCAHLEGLPLAIELAAGRATMFTPRTLASRLRAHSADVLEMTSSTMRDAPRHHRTLRTTITWSYDLLDADAQRIFRSMGVFAGGFSLTAAEAVCDNLPVDAGDPSRIAGDDELFLQHFEKLLSHSLIRQTSGDEDELRFELLETLREFALEKLEASGETAQAQERHAAYYARLADAIFFGRPSIEDEIWMRRMRAERANLQAALDWCKSRDDHIEKELLLSAVVNHSAWVSGLMWGAHAPSAGIEAWLNHVESEAMSNKIASPVARAKALHGLVERAIYEGDEQRIRRVQRAFTKFYADSGIPRLIVLGLYCTAYLSQLGGDVADGLIYFQKAREAALNFGLRDFEANALGFAGQLAFSLGNDELAEKCLKEAAVMHRELGLEWCIGEPLPQCLRLLALIAQERGNVDASLVYLDEALKLFDKHNDKSGLLASLILVGRAYLKQGRPHEALVALKQAAPMCLHWSRHWLAMVLTQMAGAKLALGEEENAARLAGAASRHASVMQHVRHPRIHLRDDYERILGEVRQRLNNKTQALWNEAATLRDDEAVALAARL